MSYQFSYRLKNDICSIEDLGNDSSRDQILLYTRNGNRSEEEEQQEEPFNLYIMPGKNSEEPNQRNRLNTEEQTSQYTGKQEQPSRQIEEDRDTVRYKEIIHNKNRTVDEVTDQLKTLSEQVRRLKKMMKRQQQRTKGSETEKRKNPQLLYLQRNNLQLFEELQKCQKQRDALEKELKGSKQTVSQLSSSIQALQVRNKELLRQNNSLIQTTKEYLNGGQEEIKYINKIRELFYQKQAWSPGLNRKLHSQDQPQSYANSRILSVDLKSKQRSFQPLQLYNSNMVLNKCFNSESYKKADDSLKDLKYRQNPDDLKYRQRRRFISSMDLQKYSNSQPKSKSIKLLNSRSAARQM